MHILFTILLLTSTIGVSVSKHYCGGKLLEIAINSQPNPCGDDASMPTDCCEDETQYFAVDDTFKADQQTIKITAPTTIILTLVQTIIPELLIAEDTNLATYRRSHDPPSAGQDIYIHIQSFLL